MKHQSSRRPHGFTLIELLVVISIIVVLAAAGFAAGNAAIQKARKTTALATATAIETAVNTFYNDYGSLPAEGSSDAEFDTVRDRQLLNVLLGLEGTAGNPLNSRGIKFLSVKEGKANKNGLIYETGGSSIRGLYDPWGGSYKIRMDLDYDERLVGVKPKGGTAVTLNGRRVAVWSDGLDGVSATGKATDDVKTWGN